MFRKLTLTCAAALGLTAAATPAMASPHGVDVRIGFGGPPVVVRPDFGRSPVVVLRPDFGHFRWQERIFDCRFEARRFAALMRDRGFDVRMIRHRDHFHVEYRFCR